MRLIMCCVNISYKCKTCVHLQKIIHNKLQQRFCTSTRYSCIRDAHSSICCLPNNPHLKTTFDTSTSKHTTNWWVINNLFLNTWKLIYLHSVDLTRLGIWHGRIHRSFFERNYQGKYWKVLWKSVKMWIWVASLFVWKTTWQAKSLFSMWWT